MRHVKIADKVANVTCGRKTLTDKNQTYFESMWPKGHVDDLIRRGFLVEVEGEEKKISNPANAEVSPLKRKLTKDNLKNDPELRKAGLKVGDEIEIPAIGETEKEEK